MRSRLRRFLSLLLVLQQFTIPSSSRAAIDLPAGKPLGGRAPSGLASDPTGGSAVVANAFTGEATTRLPILVPPGTGGLTPTVSLAYHSHQSNRDNAVGVGWSLDIGSSVIQRSTRNGAPNYDASDTFELDGVDLKATGTAGRYVTENFDHSRIEHVVSGGDDYWLVLRPDGTRLYFGYEYSTVSPLNLSRVNSTLVTARWPTPVTCGDPLDLNCPGGETIVPPLIPFGWYLDRVEDRNGNVLHYRWESLNDLGMRYLREITYSDHVAGGVNSLPSFGGSGDSSLSRVRRIWFDYNVIRAEVLPTYRSGFVQTLAHRLTDIHVEVDTSRVRHYLLEYEDSPVSGRTRLVYVRERGTDDDAATAFVHHFTYGNGVAVGWSGLNPAYALPTGLSFVDGTGRDNGVRIFDVNGDGYADALFAKSGSTEAHLGGPAGFSSGSTSAWLPPIDFVDGTGFTGVVTGDFNADGRPDLLRRQIEITAQTTATGGCGTSRQHEEVTSAVFNGWLNTGGGWLPSTQNDVAPEPINPTSSNPANYLSCPSEYFPTATSIQGINTRFDQGTRVIDINGDGRDDLIYRRAVQGYDRFSSTTWQIDETRAGSVLNDAATGLQGGVRNTFHHGDLTYWAGTAFSLLARFRQIYERPRWQVPPVVDEIIWSNLNTCRTNNNKLAEAYSGMERLADLNGDGLPELLERGDFFRIATQIRYPYAAAYINHGYGWKMPGAVGTYEGLVDPGYYRFFEIYGGAFFIPGSVCVETTPSTGYDFGIRLVDYNGDGSPDLLGDGSTVLTDVLTSAPYKTTALTSVGTLWEKRAAWNSPVLLKAGDDGTDSGARVVDVNADGMPDILVDNGAYLNLAEPPDKLETVTSPFGTVTTIHYAPHSEYEWPPASNPTIDGQRRLDQSLWVVRDITVNPGAPFGQPTMTEEFEYYDPVYDIGDRAFRGFSRVVQIGPAANNVRRVTETDFHVHDALRGRPWRITVSSAPASNPNLLTTLRRIKHDYAYASGETAGNAMVARSESTVISLSSDGDALTQSAAFDPFGVLMGGSTQDAQAFMTFLRRTVLEDVEGAQPALSKREQSYDLYGNVILRKELGDASDPLDDVTTSASYAMRDTGASGGAVLLADRLATISASGAAGACPGGVCPSAWQREMEFGYDGHPPGTVARGNPTSIDRMWKVGSPEEAAVRVSQTFDAYGNTITISDPYVVGGSQQPAYAGMNYDVASQTFPTRFVLHHLQSSEVTLETLLGYETAGCGGPRGMGLVCQITDPSGQMSSVTYDRFGRETSIFGPNGAEVAIGYADTDRATANQRSVIRLRWDPNGPSPGADPNALIERTYFDGLGRTLRETKAGISQDANRYVSYDAAGRIAQVTRWNFSTTAGPATLFSYDALGRLLSRTLPDTTSLSVTYAPRQTTFQTTEPTSGLVHKRIERLDGFGRLAAIDEHENPSGTPATTSFAYDPFGQVIRVWDAVANNPSLGNPSQRHLTELVYDELGNRTVLVDPDSGMWTHEFDARGLVIFEEDPRGIQQTYDHDALGRLTLRHAVNPPSAEVDTEYTYGSFGVGGPNDLGRLVRIDDGEGFEEFAYDGAGNVAEHTRTIGGKRFDFSHTYDPLGRRIETIHPDGETITWHFNKQLLTRISGSPYNNLDYVSDATYDALDRVQNLKLGGTVSSPIVSEQRTYDSVGGRLDRISASSGAGTLADLDYTVDGVGRVRSLVAQTFPVDGAALETRSFSYGYDGLDRLEQAVGPFSANPSASETRDYTYDALGNLIRKDFGSGDYWLFQYNDPQRPRAATSAIRDLLSGPALIFQYDDAGSVTRKERQDGAVTASTFFYDSLGRPVLLDPEGTAAAWGSGYDDSGRRLRSSRSDHTVSYPESDYEYHSAGHVNKHFFVAGKRVASSHLVWVAPSAAAPPLLSWRGPRIPPPPPWAWGVGYAAMIFCLAGVAARRRGKWARVRALRAVGVLAAISPALVAGRPRPGGIGEVGMHTDAVLFYVTDHLGSTLLTVRGDGSVRNRYIYEPFGDMSVEEGANLHYRFTGEEGLTPFYAMGPRLYDAEIGKFLGVDPLVSDLEDPQAYNPYSYALNNPLNLVDPTGLAATASNEDPNEFPWWLLFSIRIPVGGDGGFKNAATARTVGRGIAPGERTVGQQILDEILDLAIGDIVKDLQIIFSDPRDEYTLWQRVKALLDLVFELTPQAKLLKLGKLGTRLGIKGYDKIREIQKAERASKAANRAASRAKGIPDSAIGPSGLPKRHTVEHTTRKEAREAAQREVPPGGKVRHDANPMDRRQGPHFQVEDAAGENVRPVVHHEYPK